MSSAEGARCSGEAGHVTRAVQVGQRLTHRPVPGDAHCVEAMRHVAHRPPPSVVLAYGLLTDSALICRVFPRGRADEYAVERIGCQCCWGLLLRGGVGHLVSFIPVELKGDRSKEACPRVVRVVLVLVPMPPKLIRWSFSDGRQRRQFSRAELWRGRVCRLRLSIARAAHAAEERRPPPLATPFIAWSL